jgi:hypothetical protein
MPIGEVAYHTIGKNHTHVGIETCEHNWGTPEWAGTYSRLVWLTAHLVKAFQLTIGDVTGHFWWDPVNRPYDPTHLGWTPAEGQATGLFDWNQFVADVQAELAGSAMPSDPLPPERIPISVARGQSTDCTDGLLIGSTTYVPIRPYTACLLPDANVRWIDAERRVVVELPPVSGRNTGEPVSAGRGVQQVARPSVTVQPDGMRDEIKTAGANHLPLWARRNRPPQPKPGKAERRRNRP